MNHQPHIDNIYLYAKDTYDAKYQFLIKKKKVQAQINLMILKFLIEYSTDTDYIYKSIEEFNPNKKRKILIVFNYMIAYMFHNKNCNPLVSWLSIRGRKLSIYLVFI